MGIYLDHAATTPVKPAVAAAMQHFLTDQSTMGNPSSAHFAGRAARVTLDRLRERVAAHFICQPEEVVFNSGGSEGDTHALLGVALMLGRPVHLAISAIEHEAVQETAKLMAGQGHRVSTLPVTGDGEVPIEAVERLLREDRPDLVSVMAVNNETGVVQPVRAIAALCRQADVIFHTDAVRAVGHGLDGILTDPNINFLNGTAHKFGGPRGAGVLIQRRLRLPPLIRGGGQEQGSRAGTENLAGMAGFATALELATAAEAAAIEDLRRQLEYALVTEVPDCEIHGKRATRATHITSVSFKPRSGHKLQAALNELGIAVGTGSACHDDGAVSISPVLSAMGVEEFTARGTLRISLGWSTTAAEIEEFIGKLLPLLDATAEGLNCVI